MIDIQQWRWSIGTFLLGPCVKLKNVIVNKAADMDRGNVTLLDVMKEIRAVKTSVNDIKKSIETVKENYSELKEEIKELKTENTNLNMKMDKLEAQSKRCNVIVSGIAETNGRENWDDCENLVRDHLVSKLGMTTESVAKVEIDRAHRLPKKQPKTRTS